MTTQNAGELASNRSNRWQIDSPVLRTMVMGLSLLSGACLPNRVFRPEGLPPGPVPLPSLTSSSSQLTSEINQISLDLSTYEIDPPSDLPLLPALSLRRPTKPLLLIGGGELHEDIFKYFCSWSGSENGDILVIAWGSKIPQEYFEDIAQACGKAGAKRVTLMPAPEDFVSYFEDPVAGPKELLRKATGLFLAGGRQSLLAERLRETGFADLIQERLQEDSLVISGTSAGSAVGCRAMIAGGGTIPVQHVQGEYKQLSSVYLGQGMDLVPNVIIDQHFSQRDRLERLISAVQEAPEEIRWGIGIDEGTAAYVLDQRYIRTIGRHSITIVNRNSHQDSPPWFKLNADQIFDLKTGMIYDQDTVEIPDLEQGPAHRTDDEAVRQIALGAP